MNTTQKIQLNLYFDGRFYVALIQREAKEKLSIAKHIFGAEPSDAELYEFTLTELEKLKFSEPQKMAENMVAHCRINFKRMQRKVKKEITKKNLKKETLSQEKLRLELEQGAKMKRKQLSRIAKYELKKEKFQLKQQKKKRKLKGH